MSESEVVERLLQDLWRFHSLPIKAAFLVAALAIGIWIARRLGRDPVRLQILADSVWSIPIHLWALKSIYLFVSGFEIISTAPLVPWFEMVTFISMYALVVTLALVGLALVALHQGTGDRLRPLKRTGIAYAIGDVLAVQLLSFVMLFRTLPQG